MFGASGKAAEDVGRVDNNGDEGLERISQNLAHGSEFREGDGLRTKNGNG